MRPVNPSPSAPALPKAATTSRPSALRTRVISGFTVFFIVILFGYLGSYWLLGFTLVIASMAWWEYDHMMRISGHLLPSVLGTLSVLAVIAVRSFWPGSDALLLVLVLSIFTISVWGLFQNRPNALIDWSFALSGILYLGILFGYFPAIRSLDAIGGWAGLAVGTAACNDIGAFFAGRHFGRHKLWERLSPHKTWEGAIGGWLLGIAVAVLITLWVLPSFPPLRGALIGALIGIVSPLGDLTMSFVKRTTGVKDAGQIIPGHGGILDRIDSWLFAVPLVYYLALLLR